MIKESWDIERLVNWALESQGLAHQIENPAQAGWQLLGVRVDNGMRIDYSGRGVVDGAPDYDATIVGEAITGLPPEAAALLVRFGKLGYGEFARPDWCPEGVGAWEVVKTASGKIKWEYADPDNWRGERRPKMQFVGNQPEAVDYYRAEYTLWWTSLRELVPLVNLAMKAHEATGPRAPAMPWEGERPVIHSAGEHAA